LFQFVLRVLLSLLLSTATETNSGTSGAVAKIGKKWYTLGPFASGKAEFDGDPLVPLGGALALFERGPGSGSKRRASQGFYAEHAIGGRVNWRSVDAAPSPQSQGGYGSVNLPIDHVPFQALMKSPPKGGSSDILHVQYWAFGSIKVSSPGRFAIDCQQLHTFSIARAGNASAAVVGPFAGNIYGGSGSIGAVPVDLPEEGLYRLFARVRGKVPMSFACSLKPLDRAARLRASVGKTGMPDIVLGDFIAGPSPIEFEVRNVAASWLTVRASVRQDATAAATAGGRVEGISELIRLAPGTATQLPLVISLRDRSKGEVEAAACVRFNAVVAVVDTVMGGLDSELVLPVRLRCRKSTQSALLSFLDIDGSVGVAAVLRPRRGAAGFGDGVALPIVVSMSGVGAEPQGQADAYKMKPSPHDPGDFTFGFEDLWVLAPQRGGPHNWEDVGMRTALRAIDVLASAALSPRADPNRLVVHGHSRGGHGAWGLATRHPDRVLGVASACGWYSREEYGDANNLWVHETSLMHLDKVLLGLLHASIAENENSLHASNLKGSRALVRVASRDQAVPPWFGRRMARHLREEGVNVTFEEFDQEHWWWDTKETNDGGVMHDRSMRTWTMDAVSEGVPSLESVLDSGEFVLVASSPEYIGRFGIRILQRFSPAARAFVRIRRSSQGLLLRSANVRRLAVAPGSSAGLAMSGIAKVDGSTVRFDVESGVELCHTRSELDLVADGSGHDTCASSAAKSEASCPVFDVGRHWQACVATADGLTLSQGSELLGPIRRVFAAPWVVVVPDLPSPLETRLAAYFATGHFVAVSTATQTLTLSEALVLRATHRFVWLGEPHRFPAAARSAWPVHVGAALVDPDGTPPGDDRSEAHWASLGVGPCTFGDGHAAVFIAPAASEGRIRGVAQGGDASMHLLGDFLDLVVTATGPKALEDIVSFSFATNQPHTRAPMSNMLPDFFVIGPEFRWRGYGGVVAAGYWDARWRVAGHSAYFQC